MEQLTLAALPEQPESFDDRGHLPDAPYPGGQFARITTYGRLWVGYNLGGEKAGCEAARYAHVRPFPGVAHGRSELLPSVSGSGCWHVGMKCFYVDVYAETARLPHRSRESRVFSTSEKCATWAEAVNHLRMLILAAEQWMDAQVAHDLADEAQRRDNPCAGVGQECGKYGECAACGQPDVRGDRNRGRYVAFPHVAKAPA